MKLLAVPTLTLLALVLALPAFADDEAKQRKEEALALAEQIDELRKDEKAAEAAEAAARVPDLYKLETLKDKGAKKKLLDALGDLAKEDDIGMDARVAGVEALIALEDPKPAWKELSRLMPSDDVEEASDFDVLIVKAAGDLAQSRAIKDLEELLGKAKDSRLAKQAAISLGGFGADTRNRTKILDEMISLGRRIRPGRSMDKNVSQVAIDRWAAIEPGIVEGLNRLTNREIKNFEEWELLYEDNKRRLKDLFRDA